MIGVVGYVMAGLVVGPIGGGALTELDGVGFTAAVVSALVVIGVVEGLTGGETE